MFTKSLKIGARVGILAAYSMWQKPLIRSYNDAALTDSKRAKLEHMIAPMHNNSELHEETLITWIERCTKNRADTGYGPQGISVLFAFMLLLGIKEISLTDFAYNIHDRKPFIRRLPNIPSHAKPILLYSEEYYFWQRVKEVKLPTHQLTHIHTKNTDIPNPVSNVMPFLIVDAQKTWEKGLIVQLYQSVAAATDEELCQFVEHFVGEDEKCSQEQLLKQLRLAKLACQQYQSSLDESSHVPSISRR